MRVMDVIELGRVDALGESQAGLVIGDHLGAPFANVLCRGAATLAEAPVDPPHGLEAAKSLAKTQACLLMFERAVEVHLIVKKPARSEMDIRQAFLVVETLGDVLYFLQTAKGLLVSALHPQHLCLHDASVDPLPFSLVSLGKTVQTIDDRGAVAQSLGRGEPSCGPLRRQQQILKRLLII